MDNRIKILLAGVDYELEWSNNFYVNFKKESGKDFNMLAAKTINELTMMESYGYTGKDVSHAEINNELTHRVTEIWSMEDVAHLIYNANKMVNSIVTFEEIQDGLFKEGLGFNNQFNGYQYIAVQFVNFAVGFNGGADVKKSFTHSFLGKLHSIFIPSRT